MPAARVLAEPLTLTLAAVAARLGVSRDTVRRWCARGVAAGGRRVKLEALRPGGSWRTSEAAVERFVAATTPGGLPETPERTPAQRQKASERACDELARSGW